MKTANAALVIAAGIVLLWVITSGRTANLSKAWAALMTGATAAGGSSGSVGSTLPSLSGTTGTSSTVLPETAAQVNLDDLPSLSTLNSTSYI